MDRHTLAIAAREIMNSIFNQKLTHDIRSEDGETVKLEPEEYLALSNAFEAYRLIHKELFPEDSERDLYFFLMCDDPERNILNLKRLHDVSMQHYAKIRDFIDSFNEEYIK